MIKKLLIFLTTIMLTLTCSIPAFAMAYEPVDIRIPVEIKGEDVNEVFTIRMHSEKEGLIEEQEMQLKGGEKGEFVIPYREPGTFNVLIEEHKGDNEEIEYDDTVFTIIVTVIENEKGALEAYVVAQKDIDEGKPESVEFENKFLGETYRPSKPEESTAPTETTTPPSTPTNPGKESGEEVLGLRVKMAAGSFLLIGSAAGIGISGVVIAKKKKKDEDEE